MQEEQLKDHSPKLGPHLGNLQDSTKLIIKTTIKILSKVHTENIRVKKDGAIKSLEKSQFIKCISNSKIDTQINLILKIEQHNNNTNRKIISII